MFYKILHALEFLQVPVGRMYFLGYVEPPYKSFITEPNRKGTQLALIVEPCQVWRENGI